MCIRDSTQGEEQPLVEAFERAQGGGARILRTLADGYALPADSTRNFRGHWPLVTAKELLDATRDALADAKASKRGLDRILVVHGAQDPVVPLSCVQEFLAAARLPPEALRVVKKGGHDLTGGRGGDEACAAALDWLDSER